MLPLKLILMLTLLYTSFSPGSQQPNFCLYGYFLTFHINGIIRYVALCVWLLSFNVMFSGFICVVACMSTAFSMCVCVCVCVCVCSWIIFHWTDIPYFVYPLLVDEHLGCFYLLAGINNTAMNTHIQVFVWTYFGVCMYMYIHTHTTFLGIYLGVALLGHIVTTFSFLMHSQTAF